MKKIVQLIQRDFKGIIARQEDRVRARVRARARNQTRAWARVKVKNQN